jgi:dTDP-4-amino-4,6-dideoxygalactose transaminase
MINEAALGGALNHRGGHRPVQSGDSVTDLAHGVDGPPARDTILPVIRPNPPRLSEHMLELSEIEASGTYTNYGPVNTRLEQEMIECVFRQGECVTVCNATIGLMMAMREVVGDDAPAARKYALMPSFTFAAAAHAAVWAGLTPLLCDIDPGTWLADAASEEALLEQYAGQIAVVVPYATFGNNLDLPRYSRMAKQHGVPIVVDAAASLGSVDELGNAFGTGFEWPVVFSMHATKVFSTGEGGIVYSGNTGLIARLRAMGSFGFERSRSATMIGINSKMSEVAALTALLKLRGFSDILRGRDAIAECYQAELQRRFELQRQRGRRQARSFASVLLSRRQAPFRIKIIEDLRGMGIGGATYFSPHLAEQSYFQKHAVISHIPCTEDIACRMITLPLFDGMTPRAVKYVASALREVTAHL